MLRIIATIAATLGIAIVLGTTMSDRTTPSDDERNYGQFVDGTPAEGNRGGKLVMESALIPWAQASDKFVAYRSREDGEVRGTDWSQDQFAGLDWEDDWYEDYENGDELDEDFFEE